MHFVIYLKHVYNNTSLKEDIFEKKKVLTIQTRVNVMPFTVELPFLINVRVSTPSEKLNLSAYEKKLY